jgi:hypothetical protein
MVFCPNPVDWTTVGTVAGVVFTGGAAVGTVGTLIYAVRTANQTRSAAAKEKRLAQARRVYAWLDKAVGAGVVRLGNMSDEPVYTVVVYIVHMDGEKPGTWRGGRVPSSRNVAGPAVHGSRSRRGGGDAAGQAIQGCYTGGSTRHTLDTAPGAAGLSGC